MTTYELLNKIKDTVITGSIEDAEKLLLAWHEEKNKLDSLDDEDRKIINLIKRGNEYREISPVVHLSVKSIEARVRKMKKKFNCCNTKALITYLQ